MWRAIWLTQLVVALALLSMLTRLQAEWYDYLLLVGIVAYEILVIRSLVKKAHSVKS